MRTLTVFLAPDGPAGGVLDVLTDLSAAGLVEPFLWVADAGVALDQRDPRALDVPALGVDAGRRTPTTLNSALADVPHERRRLCVVVPLAGPEPPVTTEVEQRVSAFVEFTGTPVATTRIRVVVARPGDSAPPELLARDGWHNVFVSYEEAYGPGTPALLLSPDADPVEVGRHAAPAVAGIVGLWAGVDATPLDGVPPPSGVRAGRAFYRRVDAGAVERELRSRVLSTAPPLPEPRDQNVAATYLDNAGLACHNMAQRWWHKHRAALIGQRRTPPPPEVVHIGWRTLLARFFRFIWQALLAFPGELWQGLVVRGAAAAARRIHGVVLGAGDATYDVVVRGVTGSGLPAGWREFGVASGRLDDHWVASGLGQHTQRPDLQQMWEDFAGGALTLADAGHNRGLEPERAYSSPGIVRAAADIAPPPEQTFTDIPGHLRAELGSEVQTGDVLGADLLRRRLAHLLAQNPVLSREIGYTQQRLDAWEARHAHSYSVRVGAILAQNLGQVVAEIKRYVDWLTEVARQDAATPDGSSRRGLVWATRILAVLALAGLVTGPILGFQGRVEPWVAVLIAVLPLGLWLIFALIGYVRECRELFRDLHRRRTRLTEVEVVQANLRQATIDVRRLAEAYEQYLEWSKVVGAVLRDPFGPAPHDERVRTMITFGMPRTTRFAMARIDEDATAATATALRGDVFGIGWLGRLWREHLRGAGRQLRSHELVQRPEGMQDLRGGVAGSDLQRWADLLVAEGTTAAPGDRQWAEVMELLRGRRREFADGLLSSVQGVERGDQRPVSLREFLSGVDQPREAARGQQLAPTHFTPAGLAAQRGLVEVHERYRAQIGLSQVNVLVQLTEACPPWDFAVTERRMAVAVERDVYDPPPGQDTGAAPADGHHPEPVPERPPRSTVVPDAPQGFR